MTIALATVVVAVLAVVAVAVFGPNGVLQNALTGGNNTHREQPQSASASVVGRHRTEG